MIHLLYQLSYTAPVKNFRRIRYCIGAFLSRKTDGFSETVTLSETKGPETIGKNEVPRLLLEPRLFLLNSFYFFLFLLAGDAETGERVDLKPLDVDFLAALLAEAEGIVLELAEGVGNVLVLLVFHLEQGVIDSLVHVEGGLLGAVHGGVDFLACFRQELAAHLGLQALHDLVALLEQELLQHFMALLHGRGNPLRFYRLHFCRGRGAGL